LDSSFFTGWSGQRSLFIVGVKIAMHPGCWYEFPFNKGKLCLKGVKRYLQGDHSDRLLHAYRRDSGNVHGLSPMPYQEAIQKVADEVDRIQKTYGPSAVASLSGASLTSEK
jgi:assimilatory nitrate reductase catalytic subunit